MKLPIRTLGLAAAALLIGSALAPVSAQSQQSGLDGQVALRSDGALYLISNGQRRWVATAAASDEEINALPEGEPIYAGLALAGSAGAAAASPTKPTANQSSTTNTSTAKNTPTKNTSSGNDNTTTSSSDDGELDSTLPIQINLEGETKIKRGDSRKVEIKTKNAATCELRVQVPNDDDIEEDSKNADSGGRCRYTIEIPDDTKEGKGTIVGTVREGGKVNKQEIGITIAK